MIPTEFIQSFESQYPRNNLEYKLPSSLYKCKALSKYIVDNIELNGQMILHINDDNGVLYDMFNRIYYPTTNKQGPTTLTEKGYDIMYKRLYEKFGGNMSPKAFAFIIEDLEQLNPTMFNAKLMLDSRGYQLKKGIALQASWSLFCNEQSGEFKMDFSEYIKVIDEFDEKPKNTKQA